MENPLNKCPVCSQQLEFGQKDDVRCYCWSCNHWVYSDCPNCHGKRHKLSFRDDSLYCETCNHEWLYDLYEPSIADLKYGRFLKIIEYLNGPAFFVSFWAAVIFERTWLWYSFGICFFIFLGFVIANDILKCGGIVRWRRVYFTDGLRLKGVLRFCVGASACMLICVGVFTLLSSVKIIKNLLVFNDYESGEVEDCRFIVSVAISVAIIWAYIKLHKKPHY